VRQSILPTSEVIRPAVVADIGRLSGFLSYQSYIHRHLDWRSATEWLGWQPFFVVEDTGEILATLACPADPEHINWIRLFAVGRGVSLHRAWDVLLGKVMEQYSPQNGDRLVALAMSDWFEDLLITSGFITRQSIVVLNWDFQSPAPIPAPPGLVIRSMVEADLPIVEQIDAAAFNPLWQNSLQGLTLAYQQAAFCSVALLNGKTVGYQISTAMPLSAHLARLAVLPGLQRQHIGYHLCCQLLSDCQAQGIWRITVNTQNDNFASLSLYKRLGFQLTGEEILVYEYLE
jgi:ribosomal protein S18 acetylase RimI-like enzyme